VLATTRPTEAARFWVKTMKARDVGMRVGGNAFWMATKDCEED
jgi:hypothetical protein